MITEHTTIGRTTLYTILSVNESRICRHVSPCIWIQEYYNYCVDLLIAALKKIDEPVNIIFGDMTCDFKNTNRTIKIDIQQEHTLVKLGGRSVDEIIYGDIDLLYEDGKYLIRVPNYDYYSKLDATIEYSMPNIANLQTNKRFDDYVKRATYVAPLIYDNCSFQANHRTETITLGNYSERRARLGIPNVQNVISKNDLKTVYDRTKILVNVHQTDHHHTFEELRVLPALCNGVIVISERVPLIEKIPYAHAIIWSSYEGLEEKIRLIENEYDVFHKNIFTPRLQERLMSLHDNNIQGLIRKII